MKKTILTCLALMAISICLFVSCNAETAVPEDGVAYIRFGGNSRGLSPDYDAAAYGTLYWFYTADKTDDYGRTGVTTDEIPVKPTSDDASTPLLGLDLGTDEDGNPIYLGPFSQGGWTFTLKGYKSGESNKWNKSGATLIYSAKDITYTLKGGESRSIPVTVTPEGTTGILKFDNAYFQYKDSGKTAPDITMVATAVGKDWKYIFSTKDITDASATKIYKIKAEDNSGKYTIAFDDTKVTETTENGAELNVSADGNATYKCSVTVTFDAKDNGSDDASTFTEVTQEFYFAVYSGGAKTIISGDLTEDPQAKWKFDVAEYVLKTVDYSKLKADTGVEIGNTTLNFANAAGLDKDKTYTLVVTETDKTELDDSYIVSEGAEGDVIAVQKTYQLSMVDTDTNEKVSKFGGDNNGYVVAKLYAGKNLNGGLDYFNSEYYNTAGETNSTKLSPTHNHGDKEITYSAGGDSPTCTTSCSVNVVYNDSDATQPVVLSYCAYTGYVEMKTDHFSEFIVIDVSKLPVSVTTSSNVTKYYTSLESAFAAAAEGDTVTLLDDVTLKKTIASDKKVTLALNGKNVTANGYSIVPSAELTVTNLEGAQAQSSFIVGVAGDDGKYTHAVASDGSAYYSSLEDAVSKAAEGSTIKLVDNAKLSAGITFDKSLTIDLNGYTLDPNGKKISDEEGETFLVEAPITFKNGKIAGKTYNLFVVQEEKKDGTSNKAGLILDGINADVKALATQHAIVYLYQQSNPATLTVKDSYLKMDGSYGIGSNASGSGSYAEIEIKNSTVEVKENTTNQDNTCLFVNVDTKITISDSVIKGQRQAAVFRGIGNKSDASHKAVIRNTTFIADGTADYNTHESDKWTGGNEVGLAVVVIGDSPNTTGSYERPTTVELDNVTIKTGDGYKGKQIWITQQKDDCPVTVTGFNEDWTVNSDFNGAAVKSANGKTWYILGGDSFEKAAEEVEDDSTIKLLGDITCDDAYVCGKKNLTIDFNGHKITGNLYIGESNEVCPDGCENVVLTDSVTDGGVVGSISINDSSVTIESGNYTAGGNNYYCINVWSSDLTIDGGVFSCSSTGMNAYVLHEQTFSGYDEDSTITINDGKFTALNSGSSLGNAYIISADTSYKLALEIKDGEFSSTGINAYIVGGSSGVRYVTISGGDYKVNGSISSYLTSVEGKVTVEKCTFEGNYKVFYPLSDWRDWTWSDSNNVTVKGGKFTLTGSSNPGFVLNYKTGMLDLEGGTVNWSVNNQILTDNNCTLSTADDSGYYKISKSTT